MAVTLTCHACGMGVDRCAAETKGEALPNVDVAVDAAMRWGGSTSPPRCKESQSRSSPPLATWHPIHHLADGDPTLEAIAPTQPRQDSHTVWIWHLLACLVAPT